MGKKELSDETWEELGKTIYNENKEREKELFSREGSVYYHFMDEIRELGFNFETGMQADYVCRSNPELTKSIVLKFYKKTILREEKWSLMRNLINLKNKDLIPFFIDEFYKNDIYLREMIGNCLMETADKMYIKEYLKMLEDEELGDSRAYIIWTIEKLKSKEAIPILIKLLDNNYLRLSVLKTLNKNKDSSLLIYFEKYKDDKNTDVRNAAKNGIKTIKKISNK